MNPARIESPDAFEPVFREHHEALAPFAFRSTRDAATAEDTVQDVVGRLWAERKSVDRAIGWTIGDLVLDNVTLAAAARELERTYGVHVIVNDPSIARRTVSARLRRETVQQALDAIAVALGVAYDTRDSTFVIHRRAGE